LLKNNDYCNIFGVELNKHIINELKKENFNVNSDINKFGKKFDIITLWHVFEHLNNPLDTLIELKKN
jgi:hypothetical protein